MPSAGQSTMLYDVHVHVAEMHRHQTTDRFLYQGPNFYVRMFLRQLGVPKDLLAGANANVLVRQKLLEWISRSSVNRFVLLALDGVYDRSGRADAAHTRWVVDNDFVADLAQANAALLFGASVHPYRRDAPDELRRVMARGACLVKWIPSAQRIRLDDDLCIPFYELLAQSGVPLLIHTGNEHASSRGLNAWNDPLLLRHPLGRGVKVIAAHCGARAFLHERCYFKTFCRLAREHKHLYGDLGAFGIPTRMGALRQLRKNPELLAKVVYGSDFPAVVMARSLVFWVGFQAARELLRQTNPLERPYRLMKALDMPDEIFTRADSLLRLPPSEGSN